MPWFPVDDRFHSHPKAAAASLAAIGLWTLAGSWANDHLTNGDVPEHMVRSLSRGATELADELVTVGLWRRTKTGYRFHQWQADSDGSVRNRSKSEVIAERKNKSIGGAIGNHRRWHTGKNGKANPKCKYCHPDQGEQESVVRSDMRSDTDGGSDRTPNPPIPSHPIPKEHPPGPPLVADGEEPPREPRRKRRATKLPRDFEPTKNHHDRAREHGLDLAWELEKFHAHAEANDRRQVDWNGAFTQWLMHSVEYRRQRAPAHDNGPTGWWDN